MIISAISRCKKKKKKSDTSVRWIGLSPETSASIIIASALCRGIVFPRISKRESHKFIPKVRRCSFSDAFHFSRFPDGYQTSQRDWNRQWGDKRGFAGAFIPIFSKFWRILWHPDLFESEKRFFYCGIHGLYDRNVSFFETYDHIVRQTILKYANWFQL